LNTRKPIAPKKYTEKSQRSDKVYFVHFPMVQVELLLTSRGTTKFNLDEYIFSEWYNQYFGYGLSSIVFQEIRESKALAYAAYAYAGNPVRKNKSHFLQAYVGTQPDKLKEAVEAFQEILENMPISEAQLENARQSVLKQLAAGRIKHSDLFWTERQNQLRGYKTDMRQLIYDRLEKATGQDLIAYQKEFVQGRNYTWMILGDRDQIDFKYLKSIGKVEELSLETVFGY
jgi:predicted Zn-dependent peptidase